MPAGSATFFKALDPQESIEPSDFGPKLCGQREISRRPRRVHPQFEDHGKDNRSSRRFGVHKMMPVADRNRFLSSRSLDAMLIIAQTNATRWEAIR
jgi:hypothetical protein